MNDVIEFRGKDFEIPPLPEVPEMHGEFGDLMNDWLDLLNDINDYSESLEGATELKPEIVEAREYGVKECADVAKACFTPDVIRLWGVMNMDARNEIIQEYAKGIGDALGIDFKGIIWKDFPVGEDGRVTLGENCGDGYVSLNVGILADPGKLMYLVDTVAHEARHQLQNEAIDNPGKYPIDDETILEWAYGRLTYTLDEPSAYDPWGYTYNPMETDARYFGEAMVRELTKDLINNA